MALAGSAMAQGNTVTMKLASGESANPTATFGPTMGPRQVTVGAGPEAQWKVRASGVEPLHAELYWDGKILWVRDGGSRTGVYIGVERVHDWRQIYDGTEVLFGQAVFRAQAIGPDARAPNEAMSSTIVGGGARVSQVQAAPKAPVKPAAQEDDSEESTLMFSGEKLQAQLGIGSQPAPAPVVNPAQQRRQATLAPPTRGSVVPPISAVPPVPKPQPPTTEATVIRQSPFTAQAEPAKPLPAAGQRVGAYTPPTTAPNPITSPDVIAPPPLGERTMMATDLQQYISAAGPSSAPPMPTVNGRPATMAPPTSSFQSPVAFNASQSPTAYPAPTSEVPQVPEGDGDDPFGAFPPPETAQPTTGIGGVAAKLKVPVRTLVLAGGTLLVAILGLFINPSAPAPQAGTPQAGAPTASAPNTAPGTTPGTPQSANAEGTVVNLPFVVLTPGGTPPPASNNILQLQTGPSGIVGVILPAPMGGVDASGRPVPLPTPNLQDPIRLAAEAAAGHHYTEAAQHYEQLAVQHPEAPLFRQFAAVLRSRPVPTCLPGAPGCSASPAAQNPAVLPTAPMGVPAPR